VKTAGKESTFEVADSNKECQLAIHGGSPVRTRPLPLELDEEEIEALIAYWRTRSPCRY
jgi:hypothetical protein